MRFLLDESADLPLAHHLRRLGHDVTSIVEDYTRSIEDEDVLSIANREQRILITNDKDFGELVYQRRLSHAGVILFRLRDDAIPVKISRLNDRLAQHSAQLETYASYVVVTDKRIRVRERPAMNP
jgi:predicted nuclease of predicted toxin-antitoxin system